VLAALERYLSEHEGRPGPWALAGRLQNTGYGALQARRLAEHAWPSSRDLPFVRRGTPPLHGRGDAR
jgi:hypothetical protein